MAIFQEGITWRNLVEIGCPVGIGFTMSMFISNLAFDDASIVSSSKLAILMASCIVAIAGIILFMTNKTVLADNKDEA
ncbi:MAG: Na+/H+ antiporter NhaA [Chitinophagaceae bacterium]|nr:Na+/H+ antiporter NhaA [Chitinophagaceae bacterium]